MNRPAEHFRLPKKKQAGNPAGRKGEIIMAEYSDLIPEMITIREAAKRTGLSYEFLRQCCLTGKIVHIRAGTKFLINYGRLVNWLNTSHGENV